VRRREPASIVVETEMPFDRQRDLDRQSGSAGALCVIGSTVTMVAPSASRSTARTMTLGLRVN